MRYLLIVILFVSCTKDLQLQTGKPNVTYTFRDDGGWYISYPDPYIEYVNYGELMLPTTHATLPTFSFVNIKNPNAPKCKNNYAPWGWFK